MIRPLLLCALVLLTALPASAAPSADAKALYKSGTQHYNLAEFDQALADFKEAYRLHSDPVFLFNIAQCYRRTNLPAEAATFYRSFLREAPNAANRADVEKVLVEMDAQARAKAQETERARAAEAEKARAAAAIVAQPAPGASLSIAASPSTNKPLIKKPWFWMAVVGGAAVVATAVTLGVVFGTPPKNPNANYTVQVQ